MSVHGNYTPEARGKPVLVRRHAYDGMLAERPPVTMRVLERVLEHPDHDDGRTAWKRLGKRTLLVPYREEEDHIYVTGVSATRRSLGA